MDAARWTQVQDLFHQAVSLPPQDRLGFLKEICYGDADLQQILERLLEEDRNLSTAWEVELAGCVSQSGPDREQAALPSEDLGSYKFCKLLGQGGMGAVYQAEHRETGQIVAVKVLRAGELSTASRERFATEQRALARLSHPLIASLYASEKFRDGTPCFVMEYVDGEPLTTYCRNRQISIRERVLLFRQVCEAVQHAHEHAIIHRDLKPSNILVKADGTVRLLDFGIAKQLDVSATQSSITNLQAAPMTLGYAAPEQIIGGNVGTHTDVYALGVTLYELLTERPPLDLEGLTPGEAETAIRFQNPERPSRVMQERRTMRGVDRSGMERIDWSDLDVLCSAAIHKDPARRYRSVEAFIRDLDHWLRSEPLDARGDSIAYRLSKFGERNRRSLTAAVLAGALLIGATLWFSINLAKARNEAFRQQTKTQRVEKFVLSLFDNGDPSAGPVKSTSALTMLDRGRKQAETLTADRDFQTELYSVLGGLYEKLGYFDQANGMLQAAITNQASDRGAGPKAKAENLIALSIVKQDQSKFPEAQKLVEQGISLLKEDPRATKQDIATAESQLGAVLVASREFRKATPILEQALAIQSQPGGSEMEQANTLTRLAGAQQEAANYPAAVLSEERALSIDRHLYGDAHPRVGDDWESLGAVRQMQQRNKEAASDFKQTYKIYAGWYGEEHPKIVESLVCLGQALMLDGQYNAAREALSKALSLGLRLLGANDQVMVLALNVMGTLEQRTGHFDDARVYFRRSVAGTTAIYGPSSYMVGFALANLATLEQAAKHYAEADALYRESLKDLRAQLPANHPYIGKVDMNLGKALWNEHRYAEAEHTLQTGIDISSKAADPPAKDLEKARALLQEIKQIRSE